MTPKPTIAVIGGTGAEGRGLVKRWAAAGYPVIVGSRDAERGASSAEEYNAALEGREGAHPIRGTDNATAAAEGEIIVLTVPYAGHRATLEGLRDQLQGKILIDCTVPLKPPKVARVQLPEEGSAGQAAQQILGDEVRVVSAFQNVSATVIDELDEVPNCDVLVTGNDPDARQVAVELAEAAGMVGIHAGRIENAVAAEALTSLLIFINKKYDSHGAGIRITNIGRQE